MGSGLGRVRVTRPCRGERGEETLAREVARVEKFVHGVQWTDAIGWNAGLGW